MIKTQIKTIADLIEVLHNFDKEREVCIDTNTHGLMPIIGFTLYSNNGEDRGIWFHTDKIEEDAS